MERTVMKSLDVDTPGASKPPEVNEYQDVRKVLLRPVGGPSGREEIQPESFRQPKMKAQFNEPQLTSARRSAASSFQPGLIRSEGSFRGRRSDTRLPESLRSGE